MGVRGIQDDMSYFTPSMASHFQASSPSTPMSGLRSATSNKVPLGNSHCSIETPATSASVHLQTSFRLPIFPSQHQIQHTYSNAPPSHLTLDTSKTKNSIFATPSSSKPINLGYFNSPRVTAGNSYTSRRGTSAHTSNVNSASSCTSNNNQNFDRYNGNGMASFMMGDNLVNTNVITGNGLHVTSSTGSSGSSVSATANPTCNSSHVGSGMGALTFMKNTGMSSSTGCGLTYGSGSGGVGGMSGGSSSASSSVASSVSNNILGPSPIGICGVSSSVGGGESNYYAATDIFQVSDKHFDRF